MNLEWMTLPDGARFVSGPTLAELLALPPFAGAAQLRLTRLDDLEPLEKRAKAAGLKISWSGDTALPLPRADILNLFGEEKWALLDLECVMPDGAVPLGHFVRASEGDGGVITLAGWENRYWKISGLAAPDALLPILMQARLALAPERAAALALLAAQWQETGVHLRVEADGALKLAGLLRSRSRVYLGLEPQDWKDIRLRRIPPNANDGAVTRVTLFKILPLTAALYDQLALGAALIFVLAALLFATLATIAWKNHWPLTGVVCALGFIFTALYGLRLAGARED